MKVQCPKCQTAYRLPDDRVPKSGAGFKVRCKHCGHVIDVAAAGSTPVATSEAKWYVAAGSERQGPFTREQVLSKIAAAEIGAETYCWHKGFKGWERLGDVDEFKTEFASAEEVAETQMMSLKDIETVGGFAAPGAQDAVDEVTADDVAPAEEGSEQKDGMVWKRRETSVLFSLEDYKTRKRTGAGQAITGVVDVRPIEAVATAAPASRPPMQKVGVLNLDEGELRRVSDRLAGRRRQRNLVIAIVAGLVGAGAVAAVVAVIMTRPPAPTPAPVPAPQAEAPKPAPSSAPVAPAPVAQPAPSPVPVAAASAAAAADKGKDKGKDPGKDTGKDKGKDTGKDKGKDKGPEKAVAVAAPEPKKEAPAKAAPEDVNAMLANFRKGQGAGAAAAPAAGASDPAASATLPDQLSSGVITSVMRKKQGEVERCVKASGAPAGTPVKPVARLSVAGSGAVTSVSVGGAGAAQPCIEGALKAIKFPAFKSDNQSVTYPYTVQM